jgi:hypothetical protein
VNTEFIANILLVVEAVFTREGIVNFHNTHVIVAGNLHVAVAQDITIDFPSMSGWAS